MPMTAFVSNPVYDDEQNEGDEFDRTTSYLRGDSNRVGLQNPGYAWTSAEADRSDQVRF